MPPLRKMLPPDDPSDGRSPAPRSGEPGAFPFVLLDGNPAAAPRLGMDIFDAQVRHSGPERVNARQALVRALADERDPWDLVLKPGAPDTGASPATSLPFAQPAVVTPAPAVPAALPEKRSGPKLRIATRSATTPPFPTPTPPTGPDPGFWPTLPAVEAPLMPIPALEPKPAAAPATAAAAFPPPPRAPLPLPAVPLPPPAMARPGAFLPPTTGYAASPLATPPSAAPRAESGFGFHKIIIVLIALGLAGYGAWRAGWLPMPDLGGLASTTGTQAAPQGQTPGGASTAAAAPTQPPAPSGPSVAFNQWASEVKVNGVFQGQPVRALINGRLIGMGERASVEPDIRLVDADVSRRVLIFEEAGGQRLPVRY